MRKALNVKEGAGNSKETNEKKRTLPEKIHSSPGNRFQQTKPQNIFIKIRYCNHKPNTECYDKRTEKQLELLEVKNIVIKTI